jgi:ribonucleoside-diphosphate reductase alpha chain
MFLDDTACNLASINLMKFRAPDGTFDVERFQGGLPMFFIAQEILVDHASYPTAGSPRTAICSARWAWATRTWAA